MKIDDNHKTNIVLTGGHGATTAIAVVEEILSQKKNWKIYWIGVKNAIEGKKMSTLESVALPRLGVNFCAISTGRLQRRFTLWTIPSLLKIPLGFIQSFWYLVKLKPSVVVSFGGFASVPVIYSAKILRIPVILHEQTAVAGRASILAAKLASVIAISRENSLKYFPKAKCELTGNPLMQEITQIKPKVRLNKLPVIFITGGSRGSQSINSAVEPILRRLLSKYIVIHQSGGFDYLKFSTIKQQLPVALKKNYQIISRINPLEMAEIYKQSDVIVARAGANTVSEIIYIKRPAIFVPIPISYLDEQTQNAMFAANWGISFIIKQNKLTPNKLIERIDDICKNFNSIISEISRKVSPDADAATKFVNLISKFIK